MGSLDLTPQQLKSRDVQCHGSSFSQANSNFGGQNVKSAPCRCYGLEGVLDERLLRTLFEIGSHGWTTVRVD
ncbi:hypothetical protein C1H46_007866 [Malus baccata]|uniref:Uncharacterized protein n=1 Tax=Malus baccata TaxID=106549 RepID=A0A540N625_MALBA|nr:hypothetical protein C1H46_007866 [Malus baccata]